jgi:hypothetical protein
MPAAIDAQPPRAMSADVARGGSQRIGFGCVSHFAATDNVICHDKFASSSGLPAFHASSASASSYMRGPRASQPRVRQTTAKNSPCEHHRWIRTREPLQKGHAAKEPSRGNAASIGHTEPAARRIS